MSIFCGFDQAPICYDKGFMDSVLSSLCTLEDAFASAKQLLSVSPVFPVSGAAFGTGTTYTNVTGITAIPFTVPSAGTPNWNLLIYLGFYHDKNTCGVQYQVLIDGVVASTFTYRSQPSGSQVQPFNPPIRAVASQGNHTFTVQQQRNDGLGGCTAGTVANCYEIQALIMGYPQ